LKSEAWNGTNVSGFSALPGGGRNDDGSFDYEGCANFWSSSPSGSYAWNRGLGPRNDGVLRYDYYQRYGFSVRCVRD
jgi:uncharacterized protein (TIGR02145 family)